MLYQNWHRASSYFQILLLSFLFYSVNANAVEFSLFGDVNFLTSNKNTDKNTFRLGQIDLIANQDIGPHTNVVVELVFEDAGSGEGTSIDIERFAIDRNISENTQFGFGRYHTPLGFWNSSYHHGSLLQNTAARPFFLEFEDAAGGIMPVHMVGIKLKGNSEIFNYEIMLGNSNGLDTGSSVSTDGNRLSVFNNSDLNDSKSYVVRAGLNLFNSNLEIALNILKNNVIETAATGRSGSKQGDILYEQNITGLSLQWKFGNFNMLSEAYQMDVTQGSASSNKEAMSSTTIYTQFSYYMSHRLTLALRLETLDLDKNNAYLNELGIREAEGRTILSLSYNIEKSNSLRFEFNQRSFDDPNKDPYSSYTFQWYFLLL